MPVKRIFEPAVFLSDNLRETNGNAENEKSGMSYGIDGRGAVRVSSSDYDIDVLSNP